MKQNQPLKPQLDSDSDSDQKAVATRGALGLRSSVAEEGAGEADYHSLQFAE
jgi:hypothetical protein